MTYTKETGKKWENENGKTSHMKVSMVHDAEECEKECTATVPCIAFTFIPGMEICALKAPKDAVTSVSAAHCVTGTVSTHHHLPPGFFCMNPPESALDAGE